MVTIKLLIKVGVKLIIRDCRYNMMKYYFSKMCFIKRKKKLGCSSGAKWFSRGLFAERQDTLSLRAWTANPGLSIWLRFTVSASTFVTDIMIP